MILVSFYMQCSTFSLILRCDLYPGSESRNLLNWIAICYHPARYQSEVRRGRSAHLQKLSATFPLEQRLHVSRETIYLSEAISGRSGSPLLSAIATLLFEIQV